MNETEWKAYQIADKVGNKFFIELKMYHFTNYYVSEEMNVLVYCFYEQLPSRYPRRSCNINIYVL